MIRHLKAELLLPLTIVAAALALGASELMTTFELTPAGGDPLSDQLAGDRHGYSMLVLALFSIIALGLAVATGRRAWARATAGLGVAALSLFLIIDLPDVNRVGDVESGLGLASAEAVPQPGFWLEAGAAIVLALAAIAYATQPTEQRQAPRRLLDSQRARRRAARPRRPADSET